MTFTPRRHALVFCAAMLLMTGVGAGAFGAHALKAFTTPDMLATWQTAVLYQLIHGLGMLVVVQLYWTLHVRLLRLACYAMLLGTVIFSGSLYALVLTQTRWLGALTPIGGVLFLLAWMMVGIAAMLRRDVGNLPRQGPP